MSEIVVTDEPGSDRYAIDVDGARAGLLTYELEPQRISLMHAEIDPAMEGRGLGSRLIAFALEDARARGLAVLPFCPFVKSYIERHGEYLELVPEPSRARLGL
ncbi:MAG: GNAT family N-acetyltransferase [Solirubrobacteraceae bacterium]